SVGRARAVAMIRKDDEFQSGARGRGGDVVGAARSIGSARMNVQDAGERAVANRLQREAARRDREDDKDGDGSREDRRHEQQLLQRPAAARSAEALSVRSQVNSGSLRPKCPNAAVFL